MSDKDTVERQIEMIEVLNKTVSRQREIIKNLGKEGDKLRKRVSISESESEESKELFINAVCACENLEKKANSLEETCKEQEKSLERFIKLEKENNVLKERIEVLDEAIKDKNDAYKIMADSAIDSHAENERLKDLAADYEKYKEAFRNREKTLLDEVKTLRMENRAIDESIDSFNKAQGELQEKIRPIQCENKTLQSHLEAAKKECATKQDIINSLERARAELLERPTQKEIDVLEGQRNTAINNFRIAELSSEENIQKLSNATVLIEMELKSNFSVTKTTMRQDGNDEGTETCFVDGDQRMHRWLKALLVSI
jgi:chromosome segregation ATPase